VAGDFADLFRSGAEDVQHVTVAVDAVTATLERAGQPDRVLCADRLSKDRGASTRRA
jgi:hypothetical protein